MTEKPQNEQAQRASEVFAETMPAGTRKTAEALREDMEARLRKMPSSFAQRMNDEEQPKLRGPQPQVLRQQNGHAFSRRPTGTKPFSQRRFGAAQAARCEEKQRGSDAADSQKAPPNNSAAFLAEVRAMKPCIDEPAVREQVERVEQHTVRIAAWVERHPRAAGTVRRFTDYYLPTTRKLLSTYLEVDPQANDSAVAGQIQAEIVGILYTINQAFANLEDGLLQDTALDVSAEISALETVLAQEGLVNEMECPQV